MLNQRLDPTAQVEITDTMIRQIAIILGHERINSKYNELLEQLSSIIKLVYDQQPEPCLMTKTFLKAMDARETKQNKIIEDTITTDSKKTSKYTDVVKNTLEKNKEALAAYELKH